MAVHFGPGGIGMGLFGQVFYGWVRNGICRAGPRRLN